MDKYMKKSDVIAYIRNEAKEAQSEFEELGGESGIIAEAFEDLANELEDFHAADVAPVVHGRWIFKFEGPYRRRNGYCSACGQHSGIGGVQKNQEKPFCPNCGAKMDGAE